MTEPPLSEQVFDAVPDGLVIHDPDTGNFRHVNEAFAGLLGYHPEDLAGKSFGDIAAEEIPEHAPLGHTDPSELPHDNEDRFDCTLTDRDGNQLGVEITVTHNTVDGQTVEILSVREKKFVQDENERKFASVIETNTDGVYRADPETMEPIDLNDAFVELYGYDRDTWYSTPDLWEQSLHPTDADEVLPAFERHSENKEAGVLEYRIRTKDGDIRWVSDSFSWERNDDGEVSALVGVQTDITERKERGRELQHETSRIESLANELETTKEQLQLVLDATETGIWQWEVDTERVTWTEPMERMIGLEPGEFDGTFQSFLEFVHPDDRPRVETTIEESLEQGNDFQAEFRLRAKNDGWLWLNAQGEPVTIDGDQRMVGAVSDVTERKEKERRLRRRERQYRQLVERLPVAYYTFDDDWTFTYCNDVLADRLETPVEDVVGARLWEKFPELEGTIVEETFRAVQESGEPAACEYHFTAHEYWAELNAYPYEEGIAVLSTEITEQRQALSAILDLTPLIFFRIDAEGTIVESRGQTLTKIGLEPGELVGADVFEMYADRPHLIEAIEDALSGEVTGINLEFGSVILRTELTPIIEGETVTGIMGVSMDITDLERQRRQMEFFNSILRHDVLNGMTVIKTRAEILEDQLTGEEKRYATTIGDWCDTTTEVTQRVRRVIETLTTPDEQQSLEPIDVTSILERKIRELEHAYPDVRFESRLEPNTRAQADELLADVLGNILANAIEHNDTDGLQIETTVEQDRENVHIRVADNGSGVPTERRESIFRRGVTSHAKETGSGFGLFFVDAMIQKYGGEVRVERSQSGGACFIVTLSTVEQGSPQSLTHTHSES